MGLENVVVAQTKVDQCNYYRLLDSWKEIKTMLIAETVAGDAPILPISSATGYEQGINIDMLCQFL